MLQKKTVNIGKKFVSYFFGKLFSKERTNKIEEASHIILVNSWYLEI